MIRINLLPSRSVKKQELGRKQLLLFGLVLAVALVANVYWYRDRANADDRLKAQVANMQKEITDLDRIIGEVRNIKKENEAFEEKLRVLDTLKKQRTGPVKMLDAMASAIPKNVWLKTLKESGGAMALEGSAMTNDDLAEFMKGLQSIVWTPDGMGRLVEGIRKGAATGRVELSPSGQIKDVNIDKVGVFFTEVLLKKAAQRGDKVIDFSLTLKANYAI